MKSVFDGEVTAGIAPGTSAAEVEGALEALTNVTDVDVSGSGTEDDPWEITFREPTGDVTGLVGDATGLRQQSLTSIENAQGGGGNDLLIGHAGKTKFVFSDSWGHDVVITLGNTTLDFSGTENGAELDETGDGWTRWKAKGGDDSSTVTVYGSHDVQDEQPTGLGAGALNHWLGLPIDFSLLAPDGAEGLDGVATELTEDQVLALIDAAAARWGELGADEIALGDLEGVEFRVDDLPTGVLGLVQGRVVTLDATAAGLGWFVDATPGDDAEFPGLEDGALVADADSPAAGRVDLLTALMHELGHALDLGHVEPDDGRSLMESRLETGARVAPGEADLAAAGNLGHGSAALRLPDGDRDRIEEGLQDLQGWVTGLGGQLDDALATEVPFSDMSLADLLSLPDVGAEASAKVNVFLGQLHDIFEDPDVNSAELVTQARAAGIQLDFSSPTNPKQFRATLELLDLDTTFDLDVDGFSLGDDFLGSGLDLSMFSLNQVGGAPAFPIEGGVDLVFEFGLDDAGEFFVEDPSIELDFAFGERPVDVAVATSGGHSVSLAGDRTSLFGPGGFLEIQGSSDGVNDGLYLVLDSSFDAGAGVEGTTTVTLAIAPPDTAPAELGEATSDGQTFDITALDAPGDSFTFAGDLTESYGRSTLTVEGDQTAVFAQDASVTLAGSDLNDGTYTVASSVHDADLDTTTVTLTEVLPSPFDEELGTATVGGQAFDVEAVENPTFRLSGSTGNDGALHPNFEPRARRRATWGTPPRMLERFVGLLS